MLPAETKSWLDENYSVLKSHENTRVVPAVQSLREQAFVQLIEHGFPTTRNEDWKYTNITPLLKSAFQLQTKLTIASDVKTRLNALAACYPDYPRIVFVNGIYSAELSELPAGDNDSFLVRPFSKIATGRNGAQELLETHLGKIASAQLPFVAFNTAFLADGVLISTKQSKQQQHVQKPVHLVFITSSDVAQTVTHPRVLILLGGGSELQVIEHHLGLSAEVVLTSSVTEAMLGPAANCTYYRVVEEGRSTVHISNLHVSQEAHSRFSSHLLSIGGALARNEIHVTFRGEGCESRLAGLTIANGSQHVDNHTVLDHQVAHCQSNQQYKGIYGGRSEGVFSGTIIVRPQAQKTNAFQASNSLLLSTEAMSESRPQLKIWADDVRCTHGATVGQLDNEALYYLRSRGIPETAARAMLVEAFSGEILDQIELPEHRDVVRALVSASLAELLGGSNRERTNGKA